ncbi:MAG: heparinase II/III family protein [Terriglobia bacterium]
MSLADQLDVARWAPALRWALARVAYRYFPGLAAAVLRMDAGGLDICRPVNLLARDLVQLPRSLNDDLLDWFGRSEKILSNHFTFLNRWRELPEDIDWEPNETEEWRADLHAFDYGLDLALYFRISREERYARHLRYLIAHWVGANLPGQGSGWRLAPLARRVRNWILAARPAALAGRLPDLRRC